MSRPKITGWSFVIVFAMSFVSGCVGASPTRVVITLEPAPTPVPTNPPAFQFRSAVIQPTATSRPSSVDPTVTADGSLTPGLTPTLPEPINRPFLMRIDRISVVVGRGILLQGRVANGILWVGKSVEIISPHNDIFSPTLVAILISNTARSQVVVGDYASILVRGIEATNLSPGTLLVEAGEFETYEDALYQLQ